MARRIGRWVLLPSLLLFASACASAAAYPTGWKIAFAANTTPDGRHSRVYVANSDGSGLRAITSGTARDRAPAFSPDGKSIAFQSTNDLGLDTILIKSADEDVPARILTTGTLPQWSHDGKRILFARRLVNEYFLYQIEADGSQKEASLKPLGKGQLGRWSPDEKDLAAVVPVILSGQDRWQIQVGAAGATPRFTLTLPESLGQVVSLDWAPNGQSLLFSVMHQARYELYVTDLKSPEPRRLPRTDAVTVPVPNPAYGTWSPDGSEILFRTGIDSATEVPSGAHLWVMKADGTQLRSIWAPTSGGYPVHGTAWYGRTIPAGRVAVTPPMPRPNPETKPPVPTQPEVRPMPAVPPVQPPVKPALVLGAPHKVQSGKLFNIDQPRSPVSVRLAAPGPADFMITVPILPNKNWAARKQGLGVTLELEDGGLYRGTVIFTNGQLWATIQGRPKGGRVQIIDGQPLPKDLGNFSRGFSLTIKKQGVNLTVAVDEREILSRPVLSSPVKSAALTLENFDGGSARFPVGNVYYRRWEEAPRPAAANQ